MAYEYRNGKFQKKVKQQKTESPDAKFRRWRQLGIMLVKGDESRVFHESEMNENTGIEYRMIDRGEFLSLTNFIEDTTKLQNAKEHFLTPVSINPYDYGVTDEQIDYLIANEQLFVV